jgi:hypothetical protein
MARWMAIVALLLGFGFTAFESFSSPETRDAPMVQSMEGGMGFPTPRPLMEQGGTTVISSTTDASVQ